MPTERIALRDLLDPGGEAFLADVAARIRGGAVFIYPTETIYGIGGRYDRDDVYSRIISAKVRPPENPFILIGGTVECFAPLSLTFTPVAERLADAFWPGLLTLVLPGADSKSVAVRVSDHPFIAALAGHFPWPLFSTSANISGKPYQPAPDAIFATIGDRVDFMIDAGLLPYSLPSTVARVENDGRVAVLREGGISAAMIDAALGKK
jgi:L-threonylcarbamoyladenylate synthase